MAEISCEKRMIFNRILYDINSLSHTIRIQTQDFTGTPSSTTRRIFLLVHVKRTRSIATTTPYIVNSTTIDSIQ
jgi:hypothetical protein